MNTMSKEYIHEIENMLNSYKNGRISIGSLLNKSRAYIDLLETECAEKSNDLHASWLDVEQAYATALAREQPISDYQNYIDDGLRGMERSLRILSKEKNL